MQNQSPHFSANPQGVSSPQGAGAQPGQNFGTIQQGQAAQMKPYVAW